MPLLVRRELKLLSGFWGPLYIVKTLGQGTTPINPSKAALGGGITLGLGTLFGIPVSTTPPLFNGNGATIRAGTRLDLASRII